MQIDRRMDLDQHLARDHHPVKASSLDNENTHANANGVAKSKAGGGRGRMAKGRKRAFGQDLTNQHHEFCSQQASNYHNNIDTQLTAKQAATRSRAHSDFGVVKPSVEVVDDQLFKPQSKKRKLTLGEQNCGVGVQKATCDEAKLAVKHDHRLDECDRDQVVRADEEEEVRVIDDDEVDEDEDDDDVAEEEQEQDEDELMVEIKARELAKWDEADRFNDVCVTDYVDEIMEHLRADERDTTTGAVLADELDFMSAQNDINQRMRTVLVDWLIEVHRKFRLLPDTYFLGVSLLDRYLAKRQLHRRRLQLAGCTCLWIASKYHEIYAPEMADFVYISDNAFSDADMMQMEIEVLKTLSFTLTVPTVLNFAARYGKLSSFYLRKEREIKIIHDLIMYCVEHCLLCYDLCRKMPSELGASAFVYACISTKAFSLDTFETDALQRVVGYSVAELLPTMRQMHETLKQAKKSKYKALYKKYSSPKFSNIAKLNFGKLHTSFLF